MRIIDGSGFSGNLNASVPINYVGNAIISSVLNPDPNSPYQYQYGLNLQNHSWKIEPTLIVPPNALYSDTNINILSEAVHFVNRMKVPFVASRGNMGGNTAEVPAIFDDNWVLSVGGTGDNGQFCHNNSAVVSAPVNGAMTPSYGRDIDIAAPCTSGLVQSTDTSGGYNSFIATSASAPQVTGVTALMMSYINDATGSYTYSNMSPEDCEEILQRSATNTDTLGYDVLTGWGRLNAGKAMRMIERPFNNLQHFGTLNTSHNNTITLYSSNDTVLITERCRQLIFPKSYLKKGTYILKTYKVESTVYHSIPNSDTIVAYWPRPSSSEVWEKVINKKLRPHENATILSCNNSQAVLRGFIYEVRDLSGTLKGWWPIDSSLVLPTSKSLFEYSILTHNGSGTVGIKNKQTTSFGVDVFPNPSIETQKIVVKSDKETTLKIQLYDLLGNLLKEVYEGKIQKGNTEITSNIAGLANSMYIYVIKLGENSLSRKFIKIEQQ